MILSFSLTPGDLPSLCPASRPSTLSSPFRKKTSESILQRVQKTRERCRLSLLQFKSSPHDHSPPRLFPLPCLLQACTPLVISIAILTGSEQSQAPFNFYLKWVLPVCCSQPHIPLAPPSFNGCHSASIPHFWWWLWLTSQELSFLVFMPACCHDLGFGFLIFLIPQMG